MLAKLVEDLLHLEGRVDRLDQHRRPDGAPRDPELGLRLDEDVVPQARLAVRLELRQVEVGPRAASQALATVPEEVQARIEQARRDCLAVNLDVPLREV